MRNQIDLKLLSSNLNSSIIRASIYGRKRVTTPQMERIAQRQRNRNAWEVLE